MRLLRLFLATTAGTPPVAQIRCLPPFVLLVNLVILGLLVAYSSLNLWPDISVARMPETQTHARWILVLAPLAVLGPTAASVVLLWPILNWWSERGTAAADDVPVRIARRAANLPLALAASSLLAWLVVTTLAVFQTLTSGPSVPLALGLHIVLRPILAGLIAGVATFFGAEYVCRTHAWPRLLAHTQIVGTARLWRVRVSHRLVALWLALSVLPLTAVVLTTATQVASLDLAMHPLLGRVVSVVFLISISAAVGGAWLAWFVSQSIGRPLKTLEGAMARLRDGHFDTREAVSSTDEIGALTEGFNLMAGRLSASYSALEARNRELVTALDRVGFLEQVKRALDRFVPETARRAIEEHPEAPRLSKAPRDVTVLFLDIEGYTRLSDELPRATLNTLVERYFSQFLTPIRTEGGEINEIAGDGLMIIFQMGEPSEHAVAAVRAALAIQQQATLANRHLSRAHPPMLINIGISSGECDVGATRFQGPVGERWTFTATGPVTNLAARLGDRASGGQILLDAETARRVPSRFLLRRLGALSLKNFANAIEVWEVEGERQTRVGPPTAEVRVEPAVP